MVFIPMLGKGNSVIGTWDNGYGTKKGMSPSSNLFCYHVWSELPGLQTLAEINAKYRSVKDGDEDEDDEEDVNAPQNDRPARGFGQVCLTIYD